MGEKEDAVARLKRSLALAPSAINVIYDAVTSYEILGDGGNALWWIEVALKMGYSQSDVALQPEMPVFVADPRYPHILQQLGRTPSEKSISMARCSYAAHCQEIEGTGPRHCRQNSALSIRHEPGRALARMAIQV